MVIDGDDAQDQTESARRNRKILTGMLSGQVLGDGLIVLPGMGNSLAMRTDEGVVVIDASGDHHAPGMIDVLRSHTDDPVHAIVYSHGHLGYNTGVGVWLGHNRERGEAPPRLIAHERLPVRYERYRETMELQARLAAIQFPGRASVARRADVVLTDPTETQLALHAVDLLALAPGDDADVVAARALKAELCLIRAKEVRPFVSKSCYRSSAALLEQGHTS